MVTKGLGRSLLLAAFLLTPVRVLAEQFGSGVTAASLSKLRDLEALRVSADGAWAAFQVRQADPLTNGYQTSWYVLPTTGGNARRLAAAGEPQQWTNLGRINGAIRPEPPVWSPDGEWITYLRKEGGRTQIWRSRRSGRQTEQLTHNEGDVRRLVYSRDGRRILFESEPSRAQIEAALEREGSMGFLYDRRFFPTYSTTPVMPADASFRRVGEARLFSGAQLRARRRWAFDLASGHERVATDSETAEFDAIIVAATPSGRPDFRENAAASRTGAMAWTESRDPERQGVAMPLTLVAQPLGMDAPIVCGAAECTSQSFRGLWWRNENQIIFARGEGPVFQDTALYAWRPGEANPRLILRTPDKLVGSQSEWMCEIALDRLVCFYEQSNYPRRLVRVDLDTGAIETLYDPNPEFAHLDLGGPPQRLDIQAQSGVRAFGYLVLPPLYRSGERLPLVVVTYRCSGFLRGGVGDEYPVFAFAAAGMAVLCHNTADTDYERLARMGNSAYQDFMRGTGDPAKHRVQQGLDAAITQLHEAGVIDIERIGLTGLSFGAETVSFALFNMTHLRAAIASGAGFEPSGYYLYGSSYRDLLRAWGWGAPSATPDRWSGFALSPNVDRVRAPLLLNVADREMLSALEPVTALEDSGRAVEMYVFRDEYHVKWQPAHRLAIYQRNIDWMNFWLRGVEDADPAKAEPYQRWRAMRDKQCRLFTDSDAPWYCRQ